MICIGENMGGEMMNRVAQNVRQNPLLLGAVIIVVVAALALAWWLGSPLFINNTVNESFPISNPPVAEQTTSNSQTAANAVPEVLAKGSFRDADSFHKGSGSAGLYQVDDGSYVLRFENFDVTNGPDLHVYLAKHPDPTTSGDVNDGGYLDLGAIKGNQGAQNYPVPANTDLSQYKSVVIYCQPFHVVFSVAPLAAS
jgi:hypothetical protein